MTSRTDHLIHICAGSGIVPNFSMMKHALENNMWLKLTLIYSNKSWSDVIYRSELHRLRERFPSRAKIVHCLSRDKSNSSFGETVHWSRVTEEILREWITSRV
jgi:ferredoxin-NADP reductase